jgi:hypothetical protein
MDKPDNRMAVPPRTRPGRPSAAEQLARPQPEPAPPAMAMTCRACGRGRLRVNGAARADGARPLRCSHCGCTATLLPTGLVQRR